MPCRPSQNFIDRADGHFRFLRLKGAGNLLCCPFGAGETLCLELFGNTKFGVHVRPRRADVDDLHEGIAVGFNPQTAGEAIQGRFGRGVHGVFGGGRLSGDGTDEGDMSALQAGEQGVSQCKWGDEVDLHEFVNAWVRLKAWVAVPAHACVVKRDVEVLNVPCVEPIHDAGGGVGLTQIALTIIFSVEKFWVKFCQRFATDKNQTHVLRLIMFCECKPDAVGCASDEDVHALTPTLSQKERESAMKALRGFHAVS